MEALKLDDEEGMFDTIDVEGCGSLTFQEFFDGVTLIMRGQAPVEAIWALGGEALHFGT